MEGLFGCTKKKLQKQLHVPNSSPKNQKHLKMGFSLTPGQGKTLLLVGVMLMVYSAWEMMQCMCVCVLRVLGLLGCFGYARVCISVCISGRGSIVITVQVMDVCYTQRVCAHKLCVHSVCVFFHSAFAAFPPHTCLLCLYSRMHTHTYTQPQSGRL